MDIMPSPIDSTDTDSVPSAEVQFAELYTPYYRLLVAGVVARRLRRSDRDLVEDLVQETYLRLWAYLVPGRRVEAASGLLGVLARHAVTDHYRRRSASEVPADFDDWAQERRLPLTASAEDIAVVRLVAAELLADVAVVPTPLVLGTQTEGLLALAVAA